MTDEEKKEHKRKYDREWRKKNPDKAKRAQDNYYKKNRTKVIARKVKANKVTRQKYLKEYQDKGRWYFIKKKYGLTKEQWYAILDAQGGVCYICQRDQKSAQGRKRAKYFSVDHCHATGRVRGLLCNNCNSNILPPFEKEYAMALRVHDYLTKEHVYGEVPVYRNEQDTHSNT